MASSTFWDGTYPPIHVIPSSLQTGTYHTVEKPQAYASQRDRLRAYTFSLDQQNDAEKLSMTHNVVVTTLKATIALMRAEGVSVDTEALERFRRSSAEGFRLVALRRKISLMRGDPPLAVCPKEAEDDIDARVVALDGPLGSDQ